MCIKRNEIPIDLGGFTQAVLRIESIERRIARLDLGTLPHWLELLPPPPLSIRKQKRLAIIKKEAA